MTTLIAGNFCFAKLECVNYFGVQWVNMCENFHHHEHQCASGVGAPPLDTTSNWRYISHYSWKDNPDPDVHIVFQSEHMQVWSEDIAGRGSDEIASCLLSYFQQHTADTCQLIAYSDLCGDQNKNFGTCPCRLLTLCRQGDLTPLTTSFQSLACATKRCLLANRRLRSARLWC